MSGINTYASWDHYTVSYDEKEWAFTIGCMDKSDALKKVRIESIIVDGKNIGNAEVFEKYECDGGRLPSYDSVYVAVKYSKGPKELKSIRLKVVVSDKGIYIHVNTPKNCVVNLTGDMLWGDGGCENTYPMSLEKWCQIMRSAIGPASSNKDNVLFDRLTDEGICIDGAKKVRIKYDWEKKGYVFSAQTGEKATEKRLHIYAMKNLISEQYSIDYSPLSRERVFKGVPTGWMTWYAVKFDACEEKVLKNAKWMSENLKEYGANCIWVDWEWYHKDMKGVRDDGVDTFNPDRGKYPNGLKFVSDKIKEMGLTPALWIGFVVDPGLNEYAKENPEIILVDERWWCGHYFFDISHPKYLNEFLPKALSKVAEWGYDAVKYDAIPPSMMMHEKHHYNMYNPNLTTKQAYRQMIEKTRSILGEDCYMLACCGDNDADILWVSDIFDSSRIGADIFKWSEFVEGAVKKVFRYYPLHNHVFYPDPDNVVLRDEFNNDYQAESRIFFVSMLGLPVTFGDEFEVLSKNRINLIKKCLPAQDIHPMNIYRNTKMPSVLKMVLAIEKEWESYSILNVFNMEEGKAQTEIDLKEDIGLDDDEYIVYDYTGDKFVGIEKDRFSVNLEGCQSRVFSIRKKPDIPGIISTSRHITQGACEIESVKWENDTLCIESDVIGGAEYSITLYVPDGYKPASDLEHISGNVYRKTVNPKKTAKEKFVISFTK